MNLRKLTLWLLCGAAFACRPPASSAPDAARAKPVSVESVQVGKRPMPSTVLLAGQLKANQESDLAANASGLVIRTTVERGSYVRLGQAIAQLDTRMSTLSASEAEASAAAARMQRQAAEEECARYERLFKRGVITQQEYDRQTTNCKTAATSAAAAEARQKQAQQILGDATIRAPFPGLVSERYVNKGEYVRPDTRIAHIVDIDPLRLELTVPEDKMGAVKQGQNVEFQVAAFPDRTFTGTVHYIGPTVRSTTRDLVFEALVPNKEKLLRPGLFATARLDAGTRELPVVPKAAVSTDGDYSRVFAIVDNHLEERLVQVGPEEGEVIAILKGVNPGERIVARPNNQISDGMRVD